jgi:peptidoglycan-N-acetylglucosamine deacetylase
MVAAGLSLAGLLALAIVIVQPLAAFDVLGWVFPRIVWRVETSQPLVALSFDDGPSPEHTPRLLHLLGRHGVRATFFLIGERAAAHPRLLADIKAAGHEVANHAWSTRSTWGLSESELADNLRRTDATLGLTGPHKLFRPPGGRIWPWQQAQVRRLGYTCVLGSAYPYDPVPSPAGYIRWLVTKNLAPGVIVILHDGIPDPSRTLSSLEAILDAGRRKGLRFATVGELLSAAR